jgi:hypothetical protein
LTRPGIGGVEAARDVLDVEAEFRGRQQTVCSEVDSKVDNRMGRRES